MSGSMNPVSLRDAVPSHNEEAELATLGAVLIDSEALASVVHLVRAEDFYKGAHQRVYEAILSLFDRGQSIDLITLAEELRARGTLEQCGGATYISRLTSAVPTSANVEYYARIVQAASIRRTLARVSQEIIAQAHDNSSEISVILEDAERRSSRSPTATRPGPITRPRRWSRRPSMPSRSTTIPRRSTRGSLRGSRSWTS